MNSHLGRSTIIGLGRSPTVGSVRLGTTGTTSATLTPSERWLSEARSALSTTLAYPFDPKWADELAQMENDVFAAVNADRHAAGLLAYARNPVLDQIAQWAADQRAWAQYLDHVDHIPPDEIGNTTGAQVDRAFGQRFVDFSYVAPIGENMAYGFTDAASVEAAFMSDPGHASNVLNTTFTEIGIGVARSNQNCAHGLTPIAVPGLVWTVQDFGARQVGPPPPPPVPSGAVLDQWLKTVLPLIQATSQYKKWAAATTASGKADVQKWAAFLASPKGPVPTMKSTYGQALVADLHLAATS